MVEPTTVDQPSKVEPGSALVRAEKRLPILPAWAKDAEEFRTAAKWALGYAGHTAGFHAVRCPVYVARVVARVPAGTWRLLSGLLHWVTDAEGRPVRHASARREDAAEYLKLSQQRDGRSGLARCSRSVSAWPCWRRCCSVTRCSPPPCSGPRQCSRWPVWAGWERLRISRSRRGGESTKVPKLTSGAVETALASLGISLINQALGKGGTDRVSASDRS
ncbi:hypothetical protein [Saccharopolyspora gregorii]|uniref:Uncharacterized protein n=1 Tax=Saccharopolyspora gregorii TaxID=33914 RepID=A0ABP6RHN9_9PSEU